MAFDTDKHPRGTHGKFSAGAASVDAHPVRLTIHRAQRDARLSSLDNRATALMRDAPAAKPAPETPAARPARLMPMPSAPKADERRSLVRSSKAWTIGSRTAGMPVAYTGSASTELPVGGFKRAQLDFHPKPSDVTQDEHASLRLKLRSSIVALRGPTIEAGMQPKKRGKQRNMVLIPAGTDKQTVNRAYNHAAALALHGYGIGHYDFAMSDELKGELKPLEGFIRYAQRNVQAHMLATQKGLWKPYRAVHGVPFKDNRRDPQTNAVRLRVPPQHVLIKAFEEAKHARGHGGKFAAKAAAAPTEDVATSAGRKLKVRYEVVPGASLKQGTGALQPRERDDRKAYEAQVDEISAKLDPKRLMRAPEVDRGAPVVGRDHVVESGNGRVRAILQAADLHPARYGAYVQALKDNGHDVANIKTPVLIARRVSRLSPAQRIAFVREANTSATATMSASEEAKVDGHALTPSMMARYDPNQSPTAAGNRSFIRSWMASMPASERNNLSMADGTLSARGLSRMHGAILARAYDNAGVLARGLEAVDDNSRSVTGAMLDAAPAWAALRMATKGGQVPKAFDVANQLVDAIGTVQNAREKRQQLSDITTQGDIFGKPDPIKVLFMRALFAPDGKRLAARPMIADVLNRYANEAQRQTGLSLLAAKDQVTPLSALQTIVGNRDANAPKKQAGLFDRVAKLSKAFEEERHARASNGEFASGGESTDLVQPAQIIGGAIGASLAGGAAGLVSKKRIEGVSGVVGRRLAAGLRLHARLAGAMKDPNAANLVRNQAKLVGHLSHVGTRSALKLGIGIAAGLAGDVGGDKIARLVTGKKGADDEYRHASMVGMATGMTGLIAGHKLVGSRLWRPLRYKGARRSLAGIAAAVIGSVLAETGGNIVDEKIKATDLIAGVNRKMTARLRLQADHAIR